MGRQRRQPSFTQNDETALVRVLLRWFGRELQRRGEIPRRVSELEMDREMEQYVAPTAEALRKSPLYPQVRGDERRLEWLICRMLENNLLGGSRGLIPKRRWRAEPKP